MIMGDEACRRRGLRYADKLADYALIILLWEFFNQFWARAVEIVVLIRIAQRILAGGCMSWVIIAVGRERNRKITN